MQFYAQFDAGRNVVKYILHFFCPSSRTPQSIKNLKTMPAG